VERRVAGLPTPIADRLRRLRISRAATPEQRAAFRGERLRQRNRARRPWLRHPDRIGEPAACAAV
jgi:hypothetical protein